MVVKTVFCYGSLMSGCWNHDRFCADALTIEPAVTTGRLYHLTYGFPAMFEALDGKVFGEVMNFPDINETLRALDYLEGYHPNGRSHYLRIKKTVTIISSGRTETAWVYVYPQNRREEIERGGILLHDGRWRKLITINTIPG
jgi:gamma-glutamylcyclotransferase (GGCT)/AIG2-like uncharacterized protein YtfP